MAEAIVDGRGSGNLAGVTEDNKLMVDASVNVSAGSESFLYGISGGDWMPLSVISGTEAILRTNTSVSIGSVSITETVPTDATKINLATQLIYSGTVIGSLIAHNPAGGSYVKVLSYDGNDNLINVGSWV